MQSDGVHRSTNIRKGEIAGEAFFIGKIMAIFLNAENETEVRGDGSGFIRILQKDHFGVDSVIFLSVNQFTTIFNHRKTLVKEALGLESE